GSRLRPRRPPTHPLNDPASTPIPAKIRQRNSKMHQGWELILDLLIALSGALLLGLLAERVRINAIIGYLLAGAIIGPGGFALVQKPEVVDVIAEIGVALLLFTIGLEFSFSRLKRMGVRALLGGIGAILATGAIFTGAA